MSTTATVSTRLLALSIAMLATACGGLGEGNRDVVVRDSAGITIVENHAAAWTDEDAWTLADEPLLSIGALDGPEEYQLFRVRAALRHPNGGLLVSNGGTNEIRVFDEDGRHVRTTGGQGAGPGEFLALRDVWRLGRDSALVADRRAGRFSVITIDGTFGRSVNFPMPPTGRRTVPQGVFDDGSLLMLASLTTGDIQDGMHVDSAVYLHYTNTGDFLTEMVQRPIQTIMLSLGDNVFVITPPYINRPSVVVQQGRWFYGEGAEYEIERFTPDGQLTHLYRRSIPNRPVTQELVDEFRDRDLGDNPPPQLREMTRTVEIPSVMPAYAELRSSTDGTLWVQNYTLPEEQPIWSAFRDDGRYLGDVVLPMGASALDIGDDYWVLVETDEFDVEYVRVYRMLKNR